MDTQPELTGIIRGADGLENIHYGQAFDALKTNMPNVGGQIRSSRSRCFMSSLTKLSGKSLTKPLPLCYLANCYKKDYLQVHCLPGWLAGWPSTYLTALTVCMTT